MFYNLKLLITSIIFLSFFNNFINIVSTSVLKCTVNNKLLFLIIVYYVGEHSIPFFICLVFASPLGLINNNNYTYESFKVLVETLWQITAYTCAFVFVSGST